MTMFRGSHLYSVLDEQLIFLLRHDDTNWQQVRMRDTRWLQAWKDGTCLCVFVLPPQRRVATCGRLGKSQRTTTP